MADTFRLACIQTSATDNLAENLDTASDLVRRARDDGADFIALPEVVALIQPDRARLRAETPVEADHPALARFVDLAREIATWLLVGSIAVKAEGEERLANRSFLLGPDGSIRARYDKIHMFDVDLDGGESFRESDTYRPGYDTAVTDLPWGRLGMTICYDVRFPELYRNLARAGADFLSVPSAFTQRTGEAHWHVLLRARAIETGAFVFAPAQCGTHAGGRQSYGHSLIVSPWGEVLANGGTEIGFVAAEIDPDAVAAARRSIPSLQQDRDYAMP